MRNKSARQNEEVIFFTNIIAPYRVFFFNELEKLSVDKKFSFEVYFMRETETGRTWFIDKSTLGFKYRVGNGLYFKYKTYFGHLNPVLICSIIKSGKEVILGAGWNNMNVLLLAFLKSCGIIKNKLSVWSEANYLTTDSQNTNVIKEYLRRWFFKQIDGNFVVPGEMAIKSFHHWNITAKNIVYLPNLVNNKVFNKKVEYDDNIDKLPTFLIVARLEENIKGILNFFEAVGVDNLRKIKVRVAGSGSSHENYQSFVKKNMLERNIIFLGDLDERRISAEYQNAQVFVLPSFSDASPLTVIEAIFCGLPVLMSDKCGNHFETVEDGVNGYLFNPHDTNEIKSKFEELYVNRHLWRKFSENSRRKAIENFLPEKKISQFIEFYTY